jgi:hypothetical protein
MTSENTIPEPGQVEKPEHGSTIYWKFPYGWRAGGRYIPRGVSAAEVVRYEEEELGNDLQVPDFFLEELDRKRIMAKDIVWVCRSEEHARRYLSLGTDDPYQEEFGPDAIVVATDTEDETGYLILADARVLDLGVVEKFVQYRAQLYTPE